MTLRGLFAIISIPFFLYMFIRTQSYLATMVQGTTDKFKFNKYDAFSSITLFLLWLFAIVGIGKDPIYL